jgi:hypothetical protein
MTAVLGVAGLAGVLITGAAVRAAAAPAAGAPGVYGWGGNLYGEIGNGAWVVEPSPVLDAMPGTVVRIAESGTTARGGVAEEF